MDRNQITAICKEVIYECVPDMEGTPLYEDTVINTDFAGRGIHIYLILVRLKKTFAERRSHYARVQTGFSDPLF